MNPLLITDLGLLTWSDAYALQQRIVAARKADAIDDVLLLCEHPHVLTIGRNASQKNLLASENVLRQKGVELRETNRGGDITYHGPGQIVGYPILNLDRIHRDVHWYVRALEEAMIRASADFGITAYRVPGKTGIWVQCPGNIPEEKLAAIGVHISRWVTSHGFAYNVSTDLRFFDLIVPCGIADRKATSLEKLLLRNVALAEVKRRLTHHLAELFSLTPREIAPHQLLAALPHVGPAF
ncbi:MAG TPA: lipoyl(octanoyl) transferase LipB [Candidatus Acidoferrum sp.]|nr:lipoyl(octanoyl) transferase LipB [Candidatus Acidoferrum sp.]